jgi:ATP synthase protein I
MGNDPAIQPPQEESDFARQVAAKASRKLRAQRDGSQGVWFGLGMSGLIGWSVAVPTLVGAMLGLWWDRHHSGQHSWTLMLLAVGLVIGCANAWHWVAQQDKAMHDDTEDRDG